MKRGDIKGFSDESRKRLMKLFSCVDERKHGRPAFVTLTYPDQWEANPEEWKRHLHNFRRELRRHVPGMAAIWRLEPQERGAAHFHLLVWGGWIDKHWLSETWYRIVGSGDEKNLRSGTRVEAMRSSHGSRWYMLKYLAVKEKKGREQTFSYPVGRYWGVWNKEKLTEDNETGNLSEAGAVRIVRVVRKYYEKKKGKRRRRKEEEMELRGIWVMLPRETSEKLMRAYNVDEERLLF